MVRHGGRARVFSCFCRVWRSGLKNRPAGHGRCATHTGARLLQPMPNLERRPARQSRPPTAPPGTEGAPRAPAHACYNQCPTWNDNQLGNHALPTAPPGTEGAPRAPAHACYNQCPTWNDNQLGNHALPHCPAGTEGAPRAPAHACYNQCRTWNDNQLGNHAPHTAPPGTEGAPTRTGARLLQPMPNLERQQTRQAQAHVEKNGGET